MVAEPRRLVYRCDRRGVGNASSGNLIVQPPADVLGISLAPVAPPGVGVAGGGRVQLAVDIDQAPTLCRTVQGSCRCNGDGYRSLLQAVAAEPALPGRRRSGPSGGQEATRSERPWGQPSSGPPGGQQTTRSGERGGDGLLQELLASLNASELAQRRFREIARVAGLIFQGYPGEKRSNKQLQASSSLFYEVFRKYDPTNRLLLQAEQELLAQELEIGRLQATLARMATQQLLVQTLARPTPFAFPLMVERFREQLSNENLAERIARMVAQLDRAADGTPEASQAPQSSGEQTPSAAEQLRLSLAFSQDTLSGTRADKSPPGTARTPRRATGRRPGF